MIIRLHYSVQKSLMTFALCGLLSCASTPVHSPPPIVETPQEQPQEKQVTLKRQIKDVDFKSRLEEKSPKKRVAILPFLDLSKERPETVLLKARDSFMDELNKSDEVIAIDSSQLKVDLTKYISSGEFNLTKLATHSQMAGVSSLLEGKVIDLRVKKPTAQSGENSSTQFEAVVRIRVINVRSGKELFHTVKTVVIEDENIRLSDRVTSEHFFSKNPELVSILIKDAFLDFTQQVIDSMNIITWEGRIAALKGEKVFLNVGRISGVQIGDILKVVEDGNEVYDPEIGYHIGKVSGQTKGTLEVVGYFGQDGAVSVIHSGAGFKENDRVELYH